MTDHPGDAREPAPALEASDIVGLLADDARLRVVAALALGASTIADVTGASGLGAREVARALVRLQSSGVVSLDGDRYRLEAGVFRDAARRDAGKPDVEDHQGASREEAKVLRAFFRAGRLVSIPSQLSKRLVILNRLAQEFEPGVRYPEADVNAILHRFHPDHASLRRYLVEEEYLTREEGVYWRTGGTYEADD